MTATVTNTETRPDGSPWSYAKVTVAPAGPAFDGNGALIGGVSYEQTDASGSAAVAGLTVGVTYCWTSPDKAQTYFTPKTNGTQTLQSCSGPYVPAGSTGLSQAQIMALLAGYSTVLPAVGTLDYDDDGNLTGTPDGVTLTYNDDGSVHTISAGGTTRTLTWDDDGNLESVA